MNYNQSSLLNNQFQQNQYNQAQRPVVQNNVQGNIQNNAMNGQQNYQQYNTNNQANQSVAQPYYQNYQIPNSYGYNQYVPYYQNNSYNQLSNKDDQEIKWVQGEAGAKAYLLAPGKRILLMDSESDTFYVKSTDQNGVPLPLRIFDYKERVMKQDGTYEQVDINQNDNTENVNKDNNIDMNQYITRDEFESKIADLKNIIQGSVKDESTIQPVRKQSNAKSNKQFNKYNSTVQSVQE